MQTLGVGPVTASTGSNTVLSVNLNGTTAGRGIIVLVWWTGATATIVSITCTGEANLSSAGAVFRVNIGGTTVSQQIFYLGNVTAGGDKTIQMTLSETSSGYGICAIEIAGGDTASWLGTATQNAASNTVNITTNSDNELIIGLTSSSSGDPSAGSLYTLITLPNAFWFDQGQYDLDAGPAGTKTFDMSAGSMITCASFKASSLVPYRHYDSSGFTMFR